MRGIDWLGARMAGVMDDGMIAIVIAYVADDGWSFYTEIQVPAKTTIMQALNISGCLKDERFCEFAKWCEQNRQTDPNHKAWYVGVYSQKKRLDAMLFDGDRVEIYRPLSYDPMARRKSRSKTRIKSKSPKM